MAATFPRMATVILGGALAIAGNGNIATAACINGRPSVASEYTGSEIVITGRVVSESDADPGNDFYPGTMYEVRVQKTYKGQPRSAVKIFSENSTGRFPMHVGREYLLFLSLETGFYLVDNCGNSDELSRASKKITAVAAESKKQIAVSVNGPTVIAFFPPVTESKLTQDADTKASLSDFEAYAAAVQGPLRRERIDFHVLYGHSFRMRIGRRVTTFRPDKIQAGYYFVEPGRPPRIEYGVMSNGWILQVAREYFGR